MKKEILKKEKSVLHCKGREEVSEIKWKIFTAEKDYFENLRKEFAEKKQIQTEG